MQAYRSLVGWRADSSANESSSSSDSAAHLERVLRAAEHDETAEKKAKIKSDSKKPTGSSNKNDPPPRKKSNAGTSSTGLPPLEGSSKSLSREKDYFSDTSLSGSANDDETVDKTFKIIKAARCKVKAIKRSKVERRKERYEKEQEARRQAEDAELEFTDPLEAQFWSYNVNTREWESAPKRVRLASKPFAKGGMRHCLKMYLHTEDGGEVLWVAKCFREPNHSREYFSEALTQVVCEDYAKAFRREVGIDDSNIPTVPTEEDENLTQIKTFRFLPVFVMKLSLNYYTMKEHPFGSLFCVEPFLPGIYEKFSDNMGRIFKNRGTWVEAALPQAFSHFSYEQSGHLICVTDLQGVKTWYTDPQIHTMDGTGFGAGNMATKGITLFKKTHTCSEICTALKLRSLDDSSDEEVMKKRNRTNMAFTIAFVDKAGQIVLQNMPTHAVHHTGKSSEDERAQSPSKKVEAQK